VRFLIDAQLPPALTESFVRLGHFAEHVNSIGLGAATDGEIWKYASATNAVLITKDADFSILTSDQAVSVVWVRLGNVTNRALKQHLDPILEEIVEALSEGERLVEVRPD
jgi:predicted nuclease of predicted toxin-antitoxin system